MGAAVKVVAVYESPFWRTNGLSGQASTNGPLSFFTYDSSPSPDGPGVITALLAGRPARAWHRSPPTARSATILAELASLFGSQAARPLRVLEKAWADDPYSGGAYDAHLGPGIWTAYGPALREPVGSLHWAGSETASEWCGYIDGAVASGVRAAAEALSA